MKTTLIRSGLSALVVLASLGVMSAPAAADDWVIPSGVGYSQSWTYTSATALNATVTEPGGAITATGTDNGTTRTMTFTLTDTDPYDLQCATSEITDAGPEIAPDDQEICAGTRTLPPVTLPDADQIGIELLMNAQIALATGPVYTLDIPPSTSVIRQADNGFSLSYYPAGDTTPHNGDWTAHIRLGAAYLGYYGYDNVPSNDESTITGALTLDQTTSCASAEVDISIPATTLCDGPNFHQFPQAIRYYGGSGAQLCVWAPLTTSPTEPARRITPNSAAPTTPHTCVYMRTVAPNSSIYG